MRNLCHLSVISARENLVSNALYFLINKSSTVKWIATFADKKSTILLSSKDIRLRCMVLFPLMHFIVKIVHYFLEVKKIWDIILPTNIKAQNMCKIFSLVPSKKLATQENLDKLSVYFSIFGLMKLTKTILTNCQVLSVFFGIHTCKFKSKHLVCHFFGGRFFRERE